MIKVLIDQILPTITMEDWLLTLVECSFTFKDKNPNGI